VKQRKPVVLSGTQASSWGAMKWTFDDLATRVSGPLQFRASNSPVFTLAAPASNATIEMGEADSVTFNSTLADFKNKAGSQPFLYHSGLLSHWGDDLLAEVSPFTAFELPEVLNNGSAPSSAVVWIGHAGVTAQTHHDKSHNIHVQIVGKKRWRLFAPDDFSKLYPFPNKHRSSRQSQLPGYGCASHHDSPILDGAPSLGNVTAWEAIVGPGEAVYVPPYWTHCVESLDTSASVSVLSPSDEEIRFAGVKWKPLPFKAASSKTIKERVVLAVLYFKWIVRRLGFGAPSLVQELVETRYYLLLPRLAGHLRLDLGWGCLKEPEVKKLRKQYDDPNDKTAQALANDMQKAAEEVGEALSTVNKGIQKILLQDYAEELASWAVGVQDAAVFLMNCFPANEETDNEEWLKQYKNAPARPRDEGETEEIKPASIKIGQEL